MMNDLEPCANILWVEDNPGDIALFREAVEQSRAQVSLRFAEDGDEALDILYQRNGWEDAETPDLVILDLNLPGTDGFAVLQNLKSHTGLKGIPTIIMSSSQSQHDIERCYEAYANSYVVKPIGFEALKQAVKNIENFWLKTASLNRKAS